MTEIDPSDPAFAFLQEMRGLVAKQESLLRETQNLGAARIASAVLTALPGAINWAATVILAVMIGLAVIAAGLVGYEWRGAGPEVVGIRAGADRCQAEAGGWQVCWIPVRIPPKDSTP